MTPEQWVFAGLTAALAVAFARSVRFPDRSITSHPAIAGAGILFVVALIAQAIWVLPTLIHADVAAPELVDCVLQFPQLCQGRGASYGQYGFLVVGALTRVFGTGLDDVFLAMQIIAALNVALLAALAYRYSGSPYAALLTVAVTGTNPIFMRVAASEDMHNMGLCLALIGLVAMDAFASTRRPLALGAAVIALGLMVHTRQTFYIFAPCAFLLGFVRGGRSLLKSPMFLAAGLVVLAVLLQRMRAGDPGFVGQMFAIFSQPVVLPTMLKHHALFDAGRFGLLPPLTIAAIVWAWLTPGMARAVALVFTLNFVATYPCGMSSPGVEFAQRLSTYAFGVLLVAMGGATLLQARIAPHQHTAVALVASFVLAALPPLLPGWRTLGEITPIHREYLSVAAAARELPQEFTEIVLPTTDSNSFGGARYAGLLERMGKTVHPVLAEDAAEMPRPWLFLENIECWTYSFQELAGVEGNATSRGDVEIRWDRVIFGRQPSPLRPPAEARPECQALLLRGTPIGPRRVISEPEDDPPFLFYASNEVPIRFYRLPPIAE